MEKAETLFWLFEKKGVARSVKFNRIRLQPSQEGFRLLARCPGLPVFSPISLLWKKTAGREITTAFFVW
ncbi:MAG: hypothetical protein Q9P90_12700 [candidate division KSB1 bacterium]|nr:hypothetical protein [candidate division KSB1 bacterium]